MLLLLQPLPPTPPLYPPVTTAGDWITVSPPPKIGGYEIICSTAEQIKDIPTNLSC